MRKIPFLTIDYIFFPVRKVIFARTFDFDNTSDHQPIILKLNYHSTDVQLPVKPDSVGNLKKKDLNWPKFNQAFIQAKYITSLLSEIAKIDPVDLNHTDDTCLFFVGKDSKIIGDQLNKDFNSLCEWFIDNKLSIHFGEEKTKSILFGTKQLLHKAKSLNIRYGDTEIKQHTKVTYLGCILDNDLSGESMVTKVLSLINGRLKFLYRKQKFFNYSLRRLLCNALIQPHYDYACSAWYPSLNKRLLKKIQISQNKCVRYCLKLDNRAHIGANEFKEINWLPTKERVSQCICVNIFKFFNNMAPDYTSEIFHPSHSRHNTRMSTYKLDLPFRKNVHGQKTLSYLGPKTWNSLPAQIKLCKNVNSFKHDIKNLYFKRLQKSDDSIFMYY